MARLCLLPFEDEPNILKCTQTGTYYSIFPIIIVYKQ